MGNKDTTTKQITGPPDFLQPYYSAIASAAYDAAGKVDHTPYAGNVQAPATQSQQDALGMGQTYAKALAGGAPPGTFTGNDLATARGDFLNPDSNPYLRANIDAATRPTYEKLTRETLPGITDAAIQQGAYGGDGVSLQRGQALGDYSNDAMSIAASMIADNYNRERTNQLNAGQNYATDASAELLPAALLSQMGTQEQGFNQIDLNNILARISLAQTTPFAGYDTAANLIGAGGGGTSSSIMPVNKTGGVVSGALGGAAAGTYVNPGWGTLIGGILGALGGAV